MVKVNFHTNIDCAKLLKWPTHLPDRVVVGDLIRSTNSTLSKYIEMEVVECTWISPEPFPAQIDDIDKPILKVQLGLVKSRYGSIPFGEALSMFERHINS